MKTFLYQVKDSSGKNFSGMMEAENLRDVRSKLRDSGYYVIKITPLKDKQSKRLIRGKVTLDTLLMFTHQLSSMIDSGLPILLCLDILWKQMDNPKMQMCIAQIRQRLNSGASLHEAVEEFPDIFPVMYRALLSVAETGAGLVPILRKLVEYLENQRKFRTKVKGALTYPIIVIVVAVIIVIGLLTFLVPIFEGVFKRLKIDLPFLTQVMINFSHILRSFSFWIGAIILIGAIIFIYKLLMGKKEMRKKRDRLKLKLIVLGKISFLASISRFVRSLGLLLAAGVPISKSLEISKATMANEYLEEGVNWAEKRIVEGEALSVALSETNLFPTLLIEMMLVGERSGTLAAMLEKVANHFEEELDFRINKFLTILEPLLIIIVGGLVVIILLSIYLPIFKVWTGITNAG